MHSMHTLHSKSVQYEGYVHSIHVYGQYSMFIRAYTYIRIMGPDGLRAVAENAVLNANYL